MALAKYNEERNEAFSEVESMIMMARIGEGGTQTRRGPESRTLPATHPKRLPYLRPITFYPRRYGAQQ